MSLDQIIGATLTIIGALWLAWPHIDAWAAANIAAQVATVLDESEREFIAAHPMEVEA